MGWNPFKKTVTYQYWNVTTQSLATEVLPDSFHDFAMVNDVVNGVNYDCTISYLNFYGGSKKDFRQIASKLDNGFYGGFAKVSIGTNYVPDAKIKDILNPTDPSKIEIIESRVVPLDYTEWAIHYLINEFNYDESTKKFTWIGVTYTVDTSSFNSTNNTVEIKDDATNVTTTLDLPVEPIADSYWVKYRKIIGTTTDESGATVNVYSPTTIWTYQIGDNKYPELDTYTEVPDQDPTNFKIFPPMGIRTANTNYPSNSPHADLAEYSKAFGIDPAYLASQFDNQPDLDKIDNALVTHGVNLKATDKHSLKYCIDFIKKLKALADTYSISSADSTTAYTFQELAGMFYKQMDNNTNNSNILTIAGVLDLPGIDLVIDFEEFSYGVKYKSIDITEYSATEVLADSALTAILNDAIDESKYGRVADKTTKYKSGSVTNTTTFSLSKPDGEGGYTVTNHPTKHTTMHYYEIHIDGSITKYSISDPLVAHYVKDTQSGQHRVVMSTLDTENTQVQFPVDWRILKHYNNQAITSLASSTISLTVYFAYWEQDEVWDWGLVIIVAMVVAYIFCQPCAAYMNAYFANLAAMSTTQLMVVGVLTLASMGVFGEDLVIIGQIGLVIVGFYNFTDGIWTAGNYMSWANATFQGIDIMNQYRMRQARDELEDIHNEAKKLMEMYEKEMEALSEIKEYLGYEKKLRDQKWVKALLINTVKEDTLIPMHPQTYINRYKNAVKIKDVYPDTVRRTC